MTSRPGFRLARSAIFAAVCVVTTALGHSMMSGVAPPTWAVACALAAATGGAWWLTGRERGASAVTGSTVATQLVLHTCFSLLQAPTAMGSMHGMEGPHGMAGMESAHHAMPMSAASSWHGWNTGMVLAHALAALVCGLWLWRGEVAAFRLGRALAAFVFAPLCRACLVLARSVPRLPPDRVVTAPRTRRLRRSPLLHVVSRRGPPAPPVCC
ncbi:hypothetical protein [Streptomyces sp. NBC_01217]|uniref:hypothetical protein n=1 Tax=Streptomyces sp. NBC_01217 TaxID=2903779 RepID=UPI002E0F64F2|nr:hypothetical protein OG507_01090 [Streptomyces sp. NBC_01217]